MRKIRTRALSLLLTLVMALGLLPGTAWAEEGGTTSLPEFESWESMGTDKAFKISSEESLKALANAVKDDDASGTYNMSGITFYLANDITLSSDWTPIGNVAYPSDGFAGTFDGNGHTISGMNINSSSSGGVGLFGTINGATIKNLKVEGTVSATKSGYVGGIVGKTSGTVTIERCSFSGSVQSSKTGVNAGAGGIIGRVNSGSVCVSGCANTADIRGGAAAGILGYCSANGTSIENCYSTGTISGSNRAGGIVGQVYATTPIRNCFTTSDAISGFNGELFNCFDNSDLPIDASLLGDAFTTDAEGNVILVWQAGNTPKPPEPSISIRSTNGDTIWVQTGGGNKNDTILYVDYQNMGDETPEVQWSFSASNEGAAAWVETTQDSDVKGYVVTAGKGGVVNVTATVTYDGEEYTDDYTLTVIPHFTTVTIQNISQPGAVAVGQTVEAALNIEGGGTYSPEQYPGLEMKYQWYKYEPMAAYPTSHPIAGATEATYTISEDDFGAEDQKYKIGVEITCGGRVIHSCQDHQATVRTADHGKLYPVAYQENRLPDEIKEDTKLEFPAVVTENGITAQIQWGGFNDVIAADGTVIRPTQGTVTVTLSAKYTYNDAFYNTLYKIVVWSDTAADEDKQNELQHAITALSDDYRLCPVYDTDTNLNRMVLADLAEKGFDDITVSVASVTEVYGGAGIGDNGDITYFYKDPNTVPAVKFGSCKVAFTLEKDGAAATLSDVPVILYWDAAKVRAAMSEEIMSQVTLSSIGGGDGLAVTENLTLPKVVDKKYWTQISWESDNEEAISISRENQNTADTLFNPYVGVVRRGEEDQTVILTAKFTFQYTNDVIGEEAPIELVNTFEVTVPAMDGDQYAEIEQELLTKLDQGFAAKGLSDALTGERLVPDEDGVYTAINDIQLPTTRDFGVDGKYMPVTLSSDHEEVIQSPGVNNAARLWVYRPGVGEEPAKVIITVTLHDDETSVTAARSFTIEVPALTQKEIDDELALMEKVKANYFNGIRGENEAIDNITTDLSPFQEVYEENGELVWVRDMKDMKGYGIVPTPIEGWEELEAWRLFKSSNPNVISHENLLVTRQEEPKNVVITSYLSSEALGKYGELYQIDTVKYAKYSELADLYYQEVTADTSQAVAAFAARAAVNEAVLPGLKLLVRGTADPTSTTAVVDTIDNVTFSLSGLDGEEWIGTTALSGLSETYTVYDVFTEMLDEYGYTAERSRGTYIVSISGPRGSLREKEHGEDSGWMYLVNGEFPDVYMGSCSLHSGDEIQVFYTEDASKVDPDYHRPSSGGASGGKGESGQTSVEVEENKSDGTYTVTLPEDSEGLQRVVIDQAEENKLVVIVHADGREEVVKKSLVSDGKAVFLLEEGATVRLVDYESAFSDVADGVWYSPAVDFVAGRRLFSGVSEDQFAPGQTLSRGMLATVLFQLEEPEKKTADLPFADVAEGAWYAQGISWAAGENIISGYGDGRFGPDDPVTREQLALMLFRYAETLDMVTSGRDTLTSFTDSGSVSAWAREAVAWAVDSGILSGRPDGTLAPGGTATRAEAAVMLRQLVALMLR